ncbi:MAG: hypothetical protein ACOX6T_08310 [Myxococcales bacterium]|jgi:hypothetical protein
MKLVFASALALLLIGAPSYAQDDVQGPDIQTVPQQPNDQTTPQPQDQPAQPGEPTEPGVGSPGEQQPQPQPMPPDQPTDPTMPPGEQPGVGGPGQQPQPFPQQPPTDQTMPQEPQPGVGGAGDQQQACPCPNCRMGPGMRGAMMMMGPMGFGPRLGQIADISVENTRDGAVIRFRAKEGQPADEVQSLARALGSHYEAMGVQMQQAEQRLQQQQQQQQPAQQ